MRATKALTAVVVLLALVVGVPALLAVTIGNPLDGWADLKVGDLTDEVVLDVLAVVVWVAWAQFAVSVTVEAAAVVRHLPRPGRVRLIPGVSQQLARTLIATVLLVGTATITLTGPVRASAAPPAGVPAVVTAETNRLTNNPAGVVVVAPHTPSAAPQCVPTTTYVIPADGTGPDTYWDIAALRCGSGENWRTVWDLNRGRSQADGSVMTDPGLLKPGWTVLLPTTQPASSSGTSDIPVTVRPGDTLSGIAAERGIPDWHQIWDESRGMSEPGGRIFTNPNLILPGWTVEAPKTTAPASTVPPISPASPAPTLPVPPPSPSTSTNPAGSAAPSPLSPSSPTPTGTSTSRSEESTPRSLSSSSSQALPIVAFSGGGVLLAGVSLAALVRLRRRQFRWRRPGRAISATRPELVSVERELLDAGNAGLVDVNWLNEALRSLVHALRATADTRLPDVVAVRMTDDVLDLFLAAAHADPPSPWTADDTAMRWSIHRDDPLSYDPEARAYHFAPFPTLVSVGYTAQGDRWLLDLERIEALSLSGDPERCLNLARFLAAELAHNIWSEMLQITLVGFGAELAEINTDRLTHTDNLDKAITSLHQQLASVRGAIDTVNVDVLTGRLHDIEGDAWAPHVLLVAPHLTEDCPALDELLTTMQEQRTRAAVALVVANAPEHGDATRWQLTVDEHGVLRIPALDLELIAHQIPADEAALLAQLLALAATTDDRAMPLGEGGQPWDSYADAAGALRSDLTEPVGDNGDRPADGLRPPDDAADIPLLPAAAPANSTTDSIASSSQRGYVKSTDSDLGALSRPITGVTRRRVETADPDLNADLADWYDSACTRPKVVLLGPVRVIAQGSLPQTSPRLAWHTEVVAYLATRPNGVLSERFSTDLWPNEPDVKGKTKVRQAVVIVRRWLGTDEDGQEYVPLGTTSGVSQGMARYQIRRALLDAQLFRRLRLRGLARGLDGVDDLWAALNLVVGVPFDERRAEGYEWLVQSTETRLDHVYSAMITDTAHTLSTHHLDAGEPSKALEAAQVALRAGSDVDITLLDLMAAADALGHLAEGDTYAQRILANNDAEIEEDLPPRTAQILMRRAQLNAGR